MDVHGSSHFREGRNEAKMVQKFVGGKKILNGTKVNFVGNKLSMTNNYNQIEYKAYKWL